MLYYSTCNYIFESITGWKDELFRNLICLNVPSCLIRYFVLFFCAVFSLHYGFFHLLYASVWQLTIFFMSISDPGFISPFPFMWMHFYLRERERDQSLEKDINLIESAHPSPPELAWPSVTCLCVYLTLPQELEWKKGPLVLLVRSRRKTQDKKDPERRWLYFLRPVDRGSQQGSDHERL